MGRIIHAAALAIALFAASSVITAQEWPRFRGNEAGVAADNPGLPETWSQTENVVWTRPIPGIGWSSPVVWGDHIFVTTVVNTAQQEPPKPGFYLGDWPASSAPHRWMVYDIDFRTGAVRWEREVNGTPPGKAKHLKNSYASETAVTDGERVYFYFANAGLYAFDFTGKPVWSKPMGPFKTRNNWGTGASPVLHRDRIYIVNDNDEQSFLAAYDTRTGKEVWKVERKEGTNWSTPFVWENDLRTEIVTSGSDRVRSYDLSGKLLWEFSGMSSISIPTPFSRFGMLYISSGYIADPKRPALAIKPGASGDISLNAGETSNQYIVWSWPTGAPYNPSPIIYGDVYYTLFDRGFFTSHDARTGKENYGRQRITADASGFTSSPWAYNGKIFAMSEEGDTYVIQAGPEFKVLGKNSLGEMTLATPAVSRGSLIVRTASKLYRISKETAAPRPATTALFDGEGLDGWKVEGAKAAVDSGVLMMRGGSGWVRTERVLSDFVLTVDMRLGPETIARMFVRTGPTFDKKKKLPSRGYGVSVTSDKQTPAKGPWSQVEITCVDQTLTVRIDGRVVYTHEAVYDPDGHIALVVERGAAEFRRVEFRPSQPSDRPREPGIFIPADEGVTMPKPIREVKPRYTAEAQSAAIRGAVVLSAVVLPDGTVGRVRILRSLDREFGLDREAVVAAKQWRFTPGMKDGQPVAIEVTMSLTFTLK